MAKLEHDSGLDDLLALDGVVLVVDPLGNYWVKFVVSRVGAVTGFLERGRCHIE